MKRIILAISLVAVSACGGGGGGGGGNGSANPCSDLNVRIFGGTQCNYNRSPVVSIVAFNEAGTPIGVCSATMVTVDDALTSAHCSLLTSVASGGLGVFADGTFHPIVAGVNHPRYDGSTGSPYDVAMITIGSVLDIGPVPLILSDPIASGESVTAFGYGRNEEFIGIPQADDFRAARLTIDAVGANFVAGISDGDRRICSGDSGGPATQTLNGVTGVVGVNSFGDRECAFLSGFVNVQNPEIYEFILSYAPDVSVI